MNNLKKDSINQDKVPEFTGFVNKTRPVNRLISQTNKRRDDNTEKVKPNLVLNNLSTNKIMAFNDEVESLDKNIEEVNLDNISKTSVFSDNVVNRIIKKYNIKSPFVKSKKDENK